MPPLAPPGGGDDTIGTRAGTALASSELEKRASEGGAMDLNKVLLIGRLTRDPELRYIASGAAVCEFGLAVNRYFRRSDGEQGKDTCFVDIVAWGRQGETCNEFLKKGSGCLIEGRLAFDSWETPEGQKRSRLRVVADRVQFMPRAGGARTEQGGSAEAAEGSESYQQFQSPGAEPPADPDVPF